jgi:hypothetical protein
MRRASVPLAHSQAEPHPPRAARPDHFRPDYPVRSPAHCAPKFVGRRVAFQKVDPGTAWKCLPEQTFWLVRVGKDQDDNL